MENQEQEKNEKRNSKGANNTLVRVLIVVIIILVLGLVYAFAFQGEEDGTKSNDNTNVSTTALNQNSNSQIEDGRAEFKTSDEGEEKTVEEATAEQDPDAVSRDEQRIVDIKSIQDALVKYKDATGNYPEQMNELMPDYLSEIPANPEPGGIDYIYTPIGKLPAQYYDLAYELEAGTSEVEGAGTHIANPDGIANP